MYRILMTICLCLMTTAGFAQTVSTKTGPVTVTKMADGLSAPWAIAFLPDGGYLITERDGALLYFKGGNRQSVKGVPKVYAKGQGGLLDAVVAGNFNSTRHVYFTYAEPRRGGAVTALARAKLSMDGGAVTDWTVLYRSNKAVRGGRHFGSRVVETASGDLYLTVGERGVPEYAQDPDIEYGKIMHIDPSGNSRIFSLGHRNPQGAALDAKGELWTVEHGARGGDEINKPERGKNYGWPIISYGVNYNGTKIGQGRSKAGLEQPRLYWDPSIAPSGMMIYSGKLFPRWKGNLFIGSLKFDMISRVTRGGGTLKEAERLFDGTYGRIRDIREAPDGSIWFLSVGDDAAYRITPAS